MASKTVRDAENQKKRKNPTDWKLPSGMVQGKRASKRQGHRHAAHTEVTAAAASSSSAAAQSPPKMQVEVTEANMDAIILDAVRDYMRSDIVDIKVEYECLLIWLNHSGEVSMGKGKGKAGRKGIEKRYEDAIVNHLKADKSTPKYLTERMLTRYKQDDQELHNLHRRKDSLTNRVTALRVAIRLMAEEVEAEYDSLEEGLEEDLDKQKNDLAKSRATLKQLKAASALNEDASDDDSSDEDEEPNQLEPVLINCRIAPVPPPGQMPVYDNKLPYVSIHFSPDKCPLRQGEERRHSGKSLESTIIEAVAEEVDNNMGFLPEGMKKAPDVSINGLRFWHVLGTGKSARPATSILKIETLKSILGVNGGKKAAIPELLVAYSEKKAPTPWRSPRRSPSSGGSSSSSGSGGRGLGGGATGQAIPATKVIITLHRGIDNGTSSRMRNAVASTITIEVDSDGNEFQSTEQMTKDVVNGAIDKALGEAGYSRQDNRAIEVVGRARTELGLVTSDAQMKGAFKDNKKGSYEAKLAVHCQEKNGLFGSNAADSERAKLNQRVQKEWGKYFNKTDAAGHELYDPHDTNNKLYVSYHTSYIIRRNEMKNAVLSLLDDTSQNIPWPPSWPGQSGFRGALHPGADAQAPQPPQHQHLQHQHMATPASAVAAGPFQTPQPLLLPAFTQQQQEAADWACGVLYEAMSSSSAPSITSAWAKLAAKNNPAMMHMAEKMMAENTETSGGIDKEKVVHVMTQLAAAS